jgi:hypothetical protein
MPKNIARHGPDTRAGRAVLAHMLGPRPKHDTNCCYLGVPFQLARAVNNPKFSKQGGWSGWLPINRVVSRVMGTSDVFNKSIIGTNTKRQI